MTARMTARRARGATVGGLLSAAAGLGVLPLGGVHFAVAVPPGVLLLLAGAAFVAGVRRAWSPAVGVLVGACTLVGFLASPTGWQDLLGGSGRTAALGSAVELVGVTVALAAGALATWSGTAVGPGRPEAPAGGDGPDPSRAAAVTAR